MDADKCEMCENTIGFVFGTCIRCGFSEISKEFNWIKVNVDHIPPNLRKPLITRHGRTYDKNYEYKSKDEIQREIRRLQLLEREYAY